MVEIKKISNFKQSEILGLKLVPLSQINDVRGSVLHMLRSDSEHFQEFGEIYFSEINPKPKKTWKKHIKMRQNFTVPVGKVLFKFYDDRKNSKSYGVKEKILIGRPDNYNLLIVPPLVWYSFENIHEGFSLIANCSSIPHDPTETLKDIPDNFDF